PSRRRQPRHSHVGARRSHRRPRPWDAGKKGRSSVVSYVLAALVFTPALIIAAAVAWGMGRKARLLKRVGLPLAILAVGALAAWGTFTINREMEVTTLHEVILEGTLGLKAGTRPPSAKRRSPWSTPGWNTSCSTAPSPRARRTSRRPWPCNCWT